jgi:hypothetical protein
VRYPVVFAEAAEEAGVGEDARGRREGARMASEGGGGGSLGVGLRLPAGALNRNSGGSLSKLSDEQLKSPQAKAPRCARVPASEEKKRNQIKIGEQEVGQCNRKWAKVGQCSPYQQTSDQTAAVGRLDTVGLGRRDRRRSRGDAAEGGMEGRSREWQRMAAAAAG